MFALGIDPGLSRCGYGAVRSDRGRLEPVVYGHLATSPGEAVATRLATLWDDLESLLEDVRPDVVVVERVLFQANARTAMSVGQASGLALAAAARRGLPVVQYSPNEVKLAVTGYGSATKEQVQAMVAALLGLAERPAPADRADALALAVTHLSSAAVTALAGVGKAPGAGKAGVGKAGVGKAPGAAKAGVGRAAGEPGPATARASRA
ncbi:MAG TPA: crossover junction endodeoxyribonuclease RuvC [Acidimicrobiales bacterium]|nr:crossover junction endodeoxyribonuclease RuvC [Acidimicrobiales bacterium]